MAQGKFTEKLIKLKCEKCKHINYTTRKNKKQVQRKIELQKFCDNCRTKTMHKEAKK